MEANIALPMLQEPAACGLRALEVLRGPGPQARARVETVEQARAAVETLTFIAVHAFPEEGVRWQRLRDQAISLTSQGLDHALTTAGELAEPVADFSAALHRVAR